MSVEEEMERAAEIFVVEAGEMLDDIEQGLLTLEHDPGSAETVNAVFRAVHTLKGSSGIFGLEHLGAFSHALESVLDSGRDGRPRGDPRTGQRASPVC